jgi:peptide-methionine (S)-S-oxide reductase
MAKATFAAGCFWGVEDKFMKMDGVITTVVGYIGGHTKNPTYEEVCTDTTGHAEAVEIDYDPEKISYEKLLDAFFKMHNPTTLNRQGPDIGSQYRSAIFYHSAKQKALAEQKIKVLDDSNKYLNAIVTEVTAATTFYKAEEYHQNYLQKNKGATCH